MTPDLKFIKKLILTKKNRKKNCGFEYFSRFFTLYKANFKIKVGILSL